MFYDYAGDFIAQNFCKALQSTKVKCISCKNIEYETQWKINHNLLISSLCSPSTLFNLSFFSLLYQIHFLQSSVSLYEVGYSYFCQKERDINLKFFFLLTPQESSALLICIVLLAWLRLVTCLHSVQQIFCLIFLLGYFKLLMNGLLQEKKVFNSTMSVWWI